MKNCCTRVITLVLAVLMVVTVFSGTERRVSAEAYTGIMHQMDPVYLNYYYDNATLYDTGCGIFSLANAVGYLTGNKLDVIEVANWAYSKGYFNGRVGTYTVPFYQKAGERYGPIHGFMIDTNGNGEGYKGSIHDTRIKDHLIKGGTAVIHVENHFMALVGYNSSSGLYHVYNSSPGTIANTSHTSGDVWVTASQLDTGNSKVDWYCLVSRAPDENEKPVISNIKVTDVSCTGYTVRCTVTDNYDIARVAFPTWTVQNGQDDLKDDFMSNELGLRNGNTYTFRVSVTEHNKESGTYVTHIYAMDLSGNIAIATTGDVEVPVDSQAPVISDIEFSELSVEGYTISCTVKDNWGLAAVAFPTWTANNGQDDLKADWWNTQKGTQKANRFTFRVNASEHNYETGPYVTHIYAKDHMGNQSVVYLDMVQLMNDTQKPVISNAVISDITEKGYTVTCKVTDNWGIHSVAFPTWTVKDGQDDLAENFMDTQRGTKNGDTYTFQVKASDHNGEKGGYVTHIYAKDCAGNVTSLALDAVEVKAHLQKITLVSKSTYKINDALLTNVKAATKVSTLLGQFQNSGLEVLDQNGKKITGNTIAATGSKINLYSDGKLIDTLTVVVPGDLNGDGTVDSTDYLKVKAAFLGNAKLSKVEESAADVDTSGTVDTTDYMRIKAHMLGTFDLYG